MRWPRVRGYATAPNVVYQPAPVYTTCGRTAAVYHHDTTAHPPPNHLASSGRHRSLRSPGSECADRWDAKL